MGHSHINSRSRRENELTGAIFCAVHALSFFFVTWYDFHSFVFAKKLSSHQQRIGCHENAMTCSVIGIWLEISQRENQKLYDACWMIYIDPMQYQQSVSINKRTFSAKSTANELYLLVDFLWRIASQDREACCRFETDHQVSYDNAWASPPVQRTQKIFHARGSEYVAVHTWDSSCTRIKCKSISRARGPGYVASIDGIRKIEASAQATTSRKVIATVAIVTAC